MRRHHPLLYDWLRRLNELDRVAESSPRLRWLCEIQGKILTFFVSRYGLNETREIDRETTLRIDHSSRPSFPVAGSGYRCEQIRPAQEIRDLLESIQTTVEGSDSPFLKHN